jgi:Mrp family chromosome partitioning ATPase
VAVNLAYELARLGGRVGLLDVDVYGPSLPVLIEPKDVAIRSSPLGKGMVYPIEHEGVKVLSLGFVSQQVRVTPFYKSPLRISAKFKPSYL